MPNPNGGFASALLLITYANARTLHVGGQSFALDTEKRTAPALAVRIGDEIVWGALFPGAAPEQTLHIQTDQEYWLGQNCPAGTYSETGISECTDCGIGHYCTGGRHRAACSGGAIGCPGTRATADVAAPEFANRPLTAEEISDNIPETDLSQWRQISCCSTRDDSYYTTLKNDLSAVNTVEGCAGGTLGVGTYLFAVRPGPGACPQSIDPFTGHAGSYQGSLMIFNHAVSYKSIYAINVYKNFVDIDGPEFTDWDFSIPTGRYAYCAVSVPPNITGQEQIPYKICVYELK